MHIEGCSGRSQIDVADRMAVGRDIRYGGGTEPYYENTDTTNEIAVRGHA